MLSRVMSLGMAGDGSTEEEQRQQSMKFSKNVDGVHIPAIDTLGSTTEGSIQYRDGGTGGAGRKPLRASYSDDFYRHNEALRKRTQANHGALPQQDPPGAAAAVTAGSVDELDPPSSLTFRNRGPFGWNDPLDVLVLPLERFLSKPECLPFIFIFAAGATMGTSAALYYLVADTSVQKVNRPTSLEMPPLLG